MKSFVALSRELIKPPRVCITTSGEVPATERFNTNFDSPRPTRGTQVGNCDPILIEVIDQHRVLTCRPER